MATLFMDGFDHYGTGETARERMLDGAWSAVDSSFLDAWPVTGPPVDGARTGPACFQMEGFGNGFSRQARRVFSQGAKAEIFCGLAFYAPQLPNATGMLRPIVFRKADNTAIVSFQVEPDGSINVLDSGGGGGSVIATTSGPVITAASWQYLECRVLVGAGTGVVELRVDDSPVINGTGLNLGTDNIAQYSCEVEAAGVSIGIYYIDDLWVRDTSGTYNTGWEGDARIAALYANADTAVSGWAAQHRQKFGEGVLDLTGGADASISAADSADFDIGSGDFTIEAFVRFLTLPSGSDKAVIAGQWKESTDERSWQLYKGGPSLDSGKLVFRISTDGASGAITQIHARDWTPELNRYYHIAVSRVSGTNYLFIDGKLQGVGVADANTYHAAAARLYVGGEEGGSSDGLNGFMDEVRFTVGTGRYSANFTVPSSAFPRSAPSDPDFADVKLLAGFDNGVDDESAASRALSTHNGATNLLPDDGDAKYKVTDDPTPIDDTFVEAALIAATGDLTLTANPTASETVTLGSKTYTFVAALTSANDVLIGADANESIDNLVAAVNQGTGEGTVYGTGTTANTDASAENLGGQQMRATALAQGTSGNSISTTETLANGSWDGATLSGGQDIPGPIEFELEPMPPQTTLVKAVEFVQRLQKSDAGTCTVQSRFKGSGGAFDTGSDRPITTEETYYSDIFEEDPDTSAGLTPSSMVGARIGLNRTT